MPRRAAVTIDLDSLYCYSRIYGLAEELEQDNRVYEVALPRFIAACERHNIRATLFAVGRDLGLGGNGAYLKELAARGHEIANHSLSHDYRLTRLSRGEMLVEVGEARQRLVEATGSEVLGFRAPGYNLNETLLAVLQDTGHRYDSSVFPCLPYYVAKAGALAWLKLRGRPSQSILCGPGVLAAPRGPYHASHRRYWRRGVGITELPISVTPGVSFPFLGSFLVLLGERRWPAFFRWLRAGSDRLVLEMHGLDWLAGPDDDLPKPLWNQPDVPVALEKKLSLFENMLASLTERYEIVPLRDMARGE